MFNYYIYIHFSLYNQYTFFHYETNGQILMEFGKVITKTMEQHIGYYLPHKSKEYN